VIRKVLDETTIFFVGERKKVRILTNEVVSIVLVIVGGDK
jgi:hypothetical protein